MSNRRVAQAAEALIEYCGRDFDGDPCPICLAPKGHFECPWVAFVEAVVGDRPQVGL